MWSSPRNLKRNGQQHTHKTTGQALIEYVLIMVLVIMAVAVVVAASGPAVGNVFSNTVANLLNLTTTPEDPMSQGDFWALVTAVASYTPDTVALITNTPAPVGDTDGDGIPNNSDKCPNNASSNNTDTDGDGIGDICDPDSTDYAVDTDGDTVKDAFDNCPFDANTDQADANSNGVGDVCEGSTPPTATVGPSPTPRDKNYPYPFSDDGDPNNWETDFSSVLKGPWNAEYWNQNVSGCSSGDSWDMSTTAAVTQKEAKLVFPRASHNSWTTESSSPHASISTDFCARFSHSFNLPAGNYTWRYKLNNASSPSADRIRITVNGSIPSGLEDWDGTNTGGYVDVAWSAPSDGTYDIEVEYVDQSGLARLEVYLLNNGMQDQGDCNWQSVTADSAGSGGSVPIIGRAAGARFWSDSPVTASNPTGMYNQGSFCIMRLRGTINLTGGIFPFVEWWDQHSIDLTTDTFWFAVRQAGTSTWYLQEVHTGKEDNYTWTHREINLANFVGIDQTTGIVAPEKNFAGKTIEVAFVVESDNDGNRGYGWFIDDFGVKEKNISLYPFPFADDMEGAVNWVGDGTWSLTTGDTYSGTKAWTDSPAGNYANTSTSSMQLNGLLDLTNPSSVINPEIAFWHHYDLAANDKIFVDVSTNLGVTWQSMRTNATDTTDYLYQAGIPVLGYKQETVPLDLDTVSGGGAQNFKGQRIMVRFRLVTDGSNTADGWYIDDVQFRNRPNTSTIFPNWCDFANDTTSLSDWVTEGTWNLEAAGSWLGSRGKPAHSGSKAFSDTPTKEYVHGTDNSLILNRIVNLSGSTDPILEFWHRWEIAAADTLYVEMSEDNGATWAPIWNFYYTDSPEHYSTASFVSGDAWSQQIAWQRVAIPLKALLSVGNTAEEIRLRWRMDAVTNSAVDDGWYVDSICIREYDDPIITLPYTDDFEGSDSDWYAGGDWAPTAEYVHTGAKSASDSPGSFYRGDSDSILELRGIVDLTSFTVGTDKPTLYYWERYGTGASDRTYVEVQIVDSAGVATGDWEPVERINANLTNVAYNRRQADLSPFIGEFIRIRWRLQALNIGVSSQAEGWNIDYVEILERAVNSSTKKPVYTLPFNDDASGGTGSWVPEGDWTALSDNRSLGSGSSLGPGQWNVNYYSKPNGTTSPTGFPAGTSGYAALGSETVPDINFNWGASAPYLVTLNNGTGAEDWMASYTRTLLFDQDTTYNIQITSNNGHRLIIDTLTVSDQWGNCGTCSTNYTTTFTANQSYSVEIQYLENTGSASIVANFSLQQGATSGVDPLGGQSWQALYHKFCNNALTTPAWNVGSPETVGVIDFDWASGAPGIVQANNFTTTSSAPLVYEMAGGVAAFPAEDFYQSLPGTSGAAGHAWTLASISGNNGSSMQALDDTGVNNSGSGLNGPELEYKVNFAAAGTYYMWVYARGVDGSSDSLHVGLDGALVSASSGIGGVTNNSTWAWTNSATLTVGSSGLHTVSILMREDGTAVDHVYISSNASATKDFTTSSITNTTFGFTGNVASIPAEGFYQNVAGLDNGLGDGYQAVTNISGSNGVAMHALPVNGIRNSGATDLSDGPILNYKVNFPSAGTYYLRIYARGTDTNSDSLHIGLDGTILTTTSGIATTANSSWGWTANQTLTIGSAGVHTVSIYMREDNNAVDHLYISTSSSATPTAFDPLSTCYTGNTNDYWGATFTRQVIVSDSTTVFFNLSSNDGYRLYATSAGGSTFNLVEDQWTSGNHSQSTQLDFTTPGVYQVKIEYMAVNASDGNNLQLTYDLQGLVFHSDAAKSTPNANNYGASLILDGQLNLAGTLNPGLSWWSRYDIGASDTITVEVNTVGGNDPLTIGGASTWATVYTLSNNTNNNWRKYFVDLTGYAGQTIVVRFRLNSLNTSTHGDGWYIDDVQVAD